MSQSKNPNNCSVPGPVGGWVTEERREGWGMYRIERAAVLVACHYVFASWEQNARLDRNGSKSAFRWCRRKEVERGPMSSNDQI
jgi:hypothetical protein